LTPKLLQKLLVAVLVVGTALVALACIWDSDTIDDELRGIPDLKRLASNRWYRHGETYYRARITSLAEKTDRTLDEDDDLAVAYERLGEREKALQILDEKFKRLEAEPNENHLYRYHANRGTVLAHSGRLEEALEELRLAVALNPEAHFGRETYQILLIEYVLKARDDSKMWETSNFLSYAHHPSMSGGQFWLVPASFEPTFDATEKLDTAQMEQVFAGVAGMLRFGGKEGPELYRVLGDLSLSERNLNLAWYFYRMAVEKDHPASSTLQKQLQNIEKHWEEAGYATPMTQAHFSLVYENSQKWLRAFHRIEGTALEHGDDPGNPKVLEGLIASADLVVPPVDLTPSGQGFQLRMLLFVVPALLLFVPIARRRRRRIAAKLSITSET
jgi:tetratricopeptide (TPR) repeat protein